MITSPPSNESITSATSQSAFRALPPDGWAGSCGAIAAESKRRRALARGLRDVCGEATAGGPAKSGHPPPPAERERGDDDAAVRGRRRRRLRPIARGRMEAMPRATKSGGGTGWWWWWWRWKEEEEEERLQKKKLGERLPSCLIRAHVLLQYDPLIHR